jgi:hypothetical protein
MTIFIGRMMNPIGNFVGAYYSGSLKFGDNDII